MENWGERYFGIKTIPPELAKQIGIISLEQK